MYCRMNVYRNNEFSESNNYGYNNFSSYSSNNENGRTVLYRITPVAVDLSDENDECRSCCNHTWGTMSNCCDCCRCND